MDQEEVALDRGNWPREEGDWESGGKNFYSKKVTKRGQRRWHRILSVE